MPTPLEVNSDRMSVHFSYLRRDIDEIKASLKILSVGFVSRTDFEEHLKADEDHESRIRSLEKNMWKWVGASSVISAGIAYLMQFLIKSSL